MTAPTCVIVGVGPGMGLAIARRFAREGFALALLARRAEALDAHAAALRDAHGVTVTTHPVDVSDFAALRQRFSELTAAHGQVDVLVYNTSLLREATPSTADPESVVDDLRINAVAALVSAQQVIPAMTARAHGHILLTGGGLALTPYPPMASLAMGKAALRNLASSLHAELAPKGIHVATVTICGMIEAGTHFDPDLIAEHYWTLYQQAPDARVGEVLYR